MNIKMKKLFVLLGVSLVVAIGFCGCGKEAEARAKAAEQKAADAEARRIAAEQKAADAEARAKAEAKARAKAEARAKAAEQKAADAEAEARARAEAGRMIALPNGVQLKMIRVEPGSFMMGSENGKSDQKPVHRVTLTQAYYLGETEVTQAQWRAVMGTTVEEQRDKADTSWPLRGVGDNNPIYYVNWHEAIAFCQKLNDEGRAPRGWKFTLPTEAQWEFAARGGNKSRGYTYSGSNDVDDVAWYASNSGDETHAVRQKGANELGLYDMSGNVWEWCLDGKRRYSSSAVTDPQGPQQNGSDRVLRGGSCGVAIVCRVAYRYDFDPDSRYYSRGFRLALVPVQ